MTKLLDEMKSMSDEKAAIACFERLKPIMESIRRHSDRLEDVLPDDTWDFPKYREMLFII